MATKKKLVTKTAGAESVLNAGLGGIFERKNMSDILTKLAVKDTATELRRAVVETMKNQDPPRLSAKIGVLDALEPLFIAIAELQVAQMDKEPNVK